MARPKTLSTKGVFNVIKTHPGFWELRYRNKVVIGGSDNRAALYRQRAHCIYWYSIISLLKQSAKSGE